MSELAFTWLPERTLITCINQFYDTDKILLFLFAFLFAIFYSSGTHLLFIHTPHYHSVLLPPDTATTVQLSPASVSWWPVHLTWCNTSTLNSHILCKDSTYMYFLCKISQKSSSHDKSHSQLCILKETNMCSVTAITSNPNPHLFKQKTKTFQCHSLLYNKVTNNYYGF